MKTGKWYVVRQANGGEDDLWLVRICTRTERQGKGWIRRLVLESKPLAAAQTRAAR